MNSIESDELYTELENPIQNDELKQSNDIMNTIISMLKEILKIIYL